MYYRHMFYIRLVREPLQALGGCAHQRASLAVAIVSHSIV